MSNSLSNGGYELCLAEALVCLLAALLPLAQEMDGCIVRLEVPRL